MILITGAAGNVGKEVLKQVAGRGVPVRASYLSADKAAQAPAGVEAVIADYARPDQLRAALGGIERVFLVCSPVPQLVDLETNVLNEAKRAGVRHIVKSSALGAGESAATFPRWHRAVEERIESSGIPYTFLRPNTFMQNYAMAYAPTIRTQGVFYGAMKDARCSYIDVRDVAAATATVLTSAGHERKIYELNGPEALTCADCAEKLSRVVGRQIRYVDLSPGDLKKGMLASGMPEWFADALIDLHLNYVSGHGADVTDTVERIAGRTPIGFNRFATDYASAFRPEVAGAA